MPSAAPGAAARPLKAQKGMSGGGAPAGLEVGEAEPLPARPTRSPLSSYAEGSLLFPMEESPARVLEPAAPEQPTIQPTESAAEANRPRSRCTELAFALVMAVIMLCVTSWILLAMIVPLIFHEFYHLYRYLLGFLSVVTLMVFAYIAEIGVGAFFWTRTYRRSKDTDWYEEWAQESRRCSDAVQGSVQAVREWSSVQHFVVVTAYKEPLEMLRLLAYSLLSQRTPGLCRDQINFVLALEEREGPEGRVKAQALRSELGAFFRHMLVTIHPPDLPGDIKGKASNFKWAVGEVEKYIRSEEARSAGICEEDCIIHVADADSLFDPNYFPNVTYDFCVRPDRESSVWQPCMIPTLNLWELPAPVRQTNLVIAVQEMMSARNAMEFKIPFSTYGLSLRTLQRIGATGSAAGAQDGDVIAEDHHLFLKGFLALESRFCVRPIFLPCLNFSVGGDRSYGRGGRAKYCRRWCANVVDRYMQAKRHMFGVCELMYFASQLARGHWCCGRRRMTCRGRARTLCLVLKLVKIHSVPYLGMWVTLGIVLYGGLKLNKNICERNYLHRLCERTLTDEAESIAAWVFSASTTMAFVGGLLTLVSFTRMLHATHHTLTNIADPNGSFMSSLLFDDPDSREHPEADEFLEQHPRSRRRLRRPILVGAGFPWFGTLLQLLCEFLVFGFIANFFLGTMPAMAGLYRLVLKGHTMEYVTAPKPLTGAGRSGGGAGGAAGGQTQAALGGVAEPAGALPRARCGGGATLAGTSASPPASSASQSPQPDVGGRRVS